MANPANTHSVENMFPLLVLHALPDASYQWAALRITGAETADADSLLRLFGQLGLAEACGGLPCLLPPSALAAMAAQPPTGLILHADSPDILPAPPPPPPGHAGPAMAVLLKLLGQLTSDADTHDIEATLKHDPELSIQLLRLVNSVAFAPGKKITSFGQAIALLGRRQLQRWLQLLLYARRGGGDAGNPLLPRSAWRASLMEGLCRINGGDREAQDEAFMVGMFSLLDQLFGKPLTEILSSLQLAEDITAALLHHEGPLGPLLALVESADKDHCDGSELAAVAAALEQTSIGTEAWCGAQIAALRWALQVSRES